MIRTKPMRLGGKAEQQSPIDRKGGLFPPSVFLEGCHERDSRDRVRERHGDCGLRP